MFFTEASLLISILVTVIERQNTDIDVVLLSCHMSRFDVSKKRVLLFNPDLTKKQK